MRLVSFKGKGHGERALGVIGPEGDVLHLAGAASALGFAGEDIARLATMEGLLGDWDRGLALARDVAARSLTRARADLRGARYPAEAITWLPPVARPPTIRDFMSFEEHVQNARARRGAAVPSEWYEFPVFYFSNPGALTGHGAEVRKPDGTDALDYELELACVIARDAHDVAAPAWRDVVAGFTIMNDWSARDVQRKEMAVGLGPAKSKDFATSLGPALVTLDELEPLLEGDRVALAMEARVNGRLLSRGNARSMHYGWGALIARASRDVYLLPGDVIGSGAVGTGCLLELGPEVHPWLRAGDEVTLGIERLGALTNRIV